MVKKYFMSIWLYFYYYISKLHFTVVVYILFEYMVSKRPIYYYYLKMHFLKPNSANFLVLYFIIEKWKGIEFSSAWTHGILFNGCIFSCINFITLFQTSLCKQDKYINLCFGWMDFMYVHKYPNFPEYEYNDLL